MSDRIELQKIETTEFATNFPTRLSTAGDRPFLPMRIPRLAIDRADALWRSDRVGRLAGDSPQSIGRRSTSSLDRG